MKFIRSIFPITISILFICLFASAELLAQSQVKTKEKKVIQILNAKVLKLVEVNGEKARKLAGDVKLKQGKVTLACDSALFYVGRNAVDAYGHVHIFDGEGTNAYCDSLKYNGEDKLTRMYSNVRLVDEKATLHTDFLVYNIETKTGTYTTGGSVRSNEMTLTSTKGYYYADSHDAYFRDSVVLLSSQYKLTTDSLRFNTASEVAYFQGPTVITMDSSIIHCETGLYDTRNDTAVFGTNTTLEQGAQTLYTDSLYYNNGTNIGRAYKNFVWADSTMDMILRGQRADYYQASGNMLATDSALLEYLLDGDTLFLTADTLTSTLDTAGNREFQAFHGVRIFKSDLQGLCDSLSFSFKDSTIWMFRDPILWSEVNQMTGDTINLKLKNSKLDAVELYPKGFIANEDHPNIYNQIKGKHIYGYFKDSQLDKMLVEGNGESIYFGRDDTDAYIGVNKAKCSRMWIYLQAAKVNQIKFLTSPDATFYPIQQIDPVGFRLDDFIWRGKERPGSKAALFQ